MYRALGMPGVVVRASPPRAPECGQGLGSANALYPAFSSPTLLCPSWEAYKREFLFFSFFFFFVILLHFILFYFILFFFLCSLYNYMYLWSTQ